MFTYRRPNEIRSTAGESFVGEGPTNEILDVYVSNKSTLPLLLYSRSHAYVYTPKRWVLIHVPPSCVSF